MKGFAKLSQVKIGVVADDFTGAMDTAGAFASVGLRCKVIANLPSVIDSDNNHDVVCINTQTRNVDAALAIAPTYRVAKELMYSGWDKLFKKVDSTGRGNLAAECKSVMDAAGYSGVIICPAFPEMGRTVIRGSLMIRGMPVTQTTEGMDRQSPVLSDSLIETMTLEGEMTPGLIPLTIVREGLNSICERMDALIKNGINAIVVDAETDVDLETLARCSLEYPNILLAGSAGLCYALGKHIAEDKTSVQPGTILHQPALIIAGSEHYVTKSQVAEIIDKRIVETISLEPTLIMGSKEDRIGYAQQVMTDVRMAISNGRNVVLDWESENTKGMAYPDSLVIGNAITSFTGLLVYGMIRSGSFKSLIISGGETAFGVLSAIGATTVEVKGEIEEGIPWAIINNGIGSGMTLVTKSGGFGDPEMFIRMMKSM